MKNQTEGECAEFVDFKRPQGKKSESAFPIAQAIKRIVWGDKLVPLENGGFEIIKEYAVWTLYPPNIFEDQIPDHWRVTVKALNKGHNHTSPDQQELEENLQCIIETLRMHH